MRKTSFLIILIVINIIGLAGAFEIDVLEDKITLTTGEIKEIYINIRSQIEDRIIIYPKGLTTWMTIEDVGPIKANENKSMKLILSPSYDSTPGTYKLSLIFSSFITGESEERSFFITLLRDMNLIIKDFSISGDFKPMGNLEIKAEIYNPGINDAKNILVRYKILSASTEIIDEFYDTIDVKREESIKNIKRIKLKENLSTGKYYLELYLLREGKIIGKKSIDFFIESYPKIEKTVEIKSFLFGNRAIINIKNVGNAIAYNESLVLNLHPISAISYKHISGPNPIFYNNSVFWKFDRIMVGEEIVIEYEVNYNYIFIITVLFLLAFLIYLYKLRSVSVRKKVLKKKDNLIDIAVEVKNNTGKDVEKVIVVDRIPILFKIRQVVGPKPLVKSSERYYELKWKLGKLKKGEERIISYKVQEVIKVEGELSLPAAEVTYSVSNKTFTKKSGNLIFRFHEF